MFKVILVGITCTLLNAQAERKSIHQTELEYNKAFYLEPTFRPVLELSLIHISEPTNMRRSRMPSSA